MAVGVETEDEGLLDLWVEWLREEFRKDYDNIMEGLVRGDTLTY